MSAAQWFPPVSLIGHLSQQPEAFEFFQAVRLLQLYLKQQKNLSAAQILDEVIEFNASLALAFQKSEIEALKTAEQSGRYIMVPTMLGLTGNLGALPLVYTQKLNSSSWAKKHGSLAFLNLFNNRLINLFYQASIKHNLPLLAEVYQDQHYLHCLYALAGYSPIDHLQLQGKEDYVFAEFGGLLQGQTLNVETIQQLLTGLLNYPVRVHQFIAEWFEIPIDSRSYLSNNGLQLGVNSFCGERVRQIDSKIQLEIGPLKYLDYRDFLPAGKKYNLLKKILSKLCDLTLIVEIRLVLHKHEINTVTLTDKNHIGLGQGAFLASKATKIHQSQTIFLLK
jgi:type VI secretion system protein ImpH